MTNKEAIEQLKWVESRMCQITCLPETFDALNLAIKVLEERPMGEWIRTGSLGNGNAQYMCSNCHHGDEHAESQEVPYCWHCGAKMMKKENDNET